MNRLTKSILIIGIILLIYGFICRLLGLNFFWDSKTIGGVLLFVALFFYLIDLRKKRNYEGKKNTWVTIGIFFLGFGLIIFPVIVIIFHNLEPYYAAKDFIKSSPKLKEQLGDVESFGLFPGGSVQVINNNGIESGHAIFEITVNGSKKNKDVIIELEKVPESSWKVIAYN